MNFSEFIYNYRKTNNLSQRDLGKKLNVSASAIGMWEAGRRYPSRYTLEQISKYTNVDINELTQMVYETPDMYLSNSDIDLEFIKLNESTNADINRRVKLYVQALANVLDIQNNVIISNDQHKLLNAYQEAPENIKLAIRSMLGISENED